MERNHLVGASDAKIIAYGDESDWSELRERILTQSGLKVSLNQRFLMDLGTVVEPVTMARFSDTVCRVERQQVPVALVTDNRIGATLDGVAEDGRPVEAKFHTGDKDIWELADYYNPQLQHQMLLHGSNRMHFTVTFGRYGKFEAIEIDENLDFQSAYLERLMTFIEYLDTGEEPDIEPVEKPAPPQPRTHNWTKADNEITSLCIDYIENADPAETFEKAKKELKAMFPDDYTQAIWTGDGDQLVMKKDRRGAIRITHRKMEAAE